MDNYSFNDYVVADQFNRIVDFNIDNKLNSMKRDKHVRGIAGEINGDVCDVYLYNATTPISNVKINTGINVFEDDDIYLLAINGNLSNIVVDSNVHNFEKLFGYKFSDFMIVDGFQDVEACTPVMEFSNLTNDYTYKKYRKQGIRQEFLNPTTKTYGMIKENLTLDLTAYPDGEATNSVNDYYGIAFYISDNTMYASTTYLSVVFGTTDSDFYYFDITSSNHTLTNGWNTFTILKNDCSSSGSPDWSNITELYYENNIDNGFDGEYLVYGVLTLFRNDTSGGGSVTTNDLLGTSNQVTVTNGTSAIVAGSDVTLSLSTNIYVSSVTFGSDSNNIIDFSTSNTISLKTNGTANRFLIDSNGHIGIATSDIETIGSGYKSIQFPDSMIMYGESNSEFYLMSNCYFDGSNVRYKSNGGASIILQAEGYVSWYVAESGTADNVVSFTIPIGTIASGHIMFNNGVYASDGRFLLDTNGFLGLGIYTVLGFGSGYKAIQLPYSNILYSSSNGALEISSNNYWNGTNYLYIQSSAASNIQMNTNGSIKLRTAISGTALATITWKDALTLDSEGVATVYSAKRYDQQITDVTENRTVKHAGLTESKGQVWISLGTYESEQKVVNVKYIGAGVCFAITQPTGYVLKSIDYGNTWFEISQFNDGAYIFNSFDYCGNGIFIAGTNNGKLYKSDDYCLTWTLKHTISSEFWVYDVTYIGNGIILAISNDNGTIVRSDDYGETWATEATFGSAVFYYHNIAYCGNGIILANGHSGNIKRSWDYGSNWEDATRPSGSDDFRDLQYCGNGIVLAVLDTNELYRSIDFGETWTLVDDLNATYSIVQSYSLGYAGDGVVLLGAYDTTLKLLIYQSVNYGETWTFFYSNTDALYVADFEYLDNGVIIAGTWRNGANNSTLLRSSIDYYQYQKHIETTDNIQCNSITLGATPVYINDSSNYPENMLTIQQNDEPTTSTIGQISLFATTGSDSTVGFRTEAEVVSATPVPDYSLPIKINGVLYKLPLELA